jgi:DNA-binding NtrC family response regulator
MSMSDQGSILVVDDEPHVSEMLEEYFAELGYSVNVATTGDEALRLTAVKRPDAVILDMRLPDTTGEQLLAKLLTLDASLPIVMLSGNLEADMARRAIAAGALQYLQKPFDFDLLRRTIVEAIETGREHRSADLECVAR